MNSITIKKIVDLKGTVKISGSKNACLPIICTSLLCKKTRLKNVPNISDVKALLEILNYLNVKTKYRHHMLLIDTRNITYKSLNIDLCRKMRASYYLIPIMLYLFKHCEIAYPGGCVIGKRPIDLHINSLQEFGYRVVDNGSYLVIDEVEEKKKINYSLPKKSVGASINSILLALNCEYAVVDNLVLEPEALDLCRFILNVGFDISCFSNRCVIKGRGKPKNISYKIIPDRIEALSYIVLGLLCGNVKVKNINLQHIRYPLDLLVRGNYKISIGKSYVRVRKSRGFIFNFKTDVYPLIPTDIQPIFGVLFSFSKGTATVIEDIFENRMQIYSDILKSGGNINVIGNKAYIIGGTLLNSVNGSCVDLRQGMALLIMALKCGGIVNEIQFIERGYDDIFRKIKSLGAKVKIN